MTRVMIAHAWRAGAAALALAAAPAVLAAQDAPGTLTMAEAVATARENNPEFLSVRNDQRSADASVRAARDAFLPTAQASTSLGYVAEGQNRYGASTLGNTPSYYTSGFNVVASLDLSASKLLQPSVARAQSRATAQRIAGAAADLESSVSQMYLSTLAAQEAVDQAQRELERTQEHLRLAQARLEVGAGTPLDVRKAEVQQGQSEVALLQARNTLYTYRLQLGQAMGVVLDVDTRLVSDFAVFEPRWTADELVETALRNNPTLLSARANAAAAQTDVKSARSAYLPTLGFDVGLSGSSYRPTDVDGTVEQQMEDVASSFADCVARNELYASVDGPQRPCLSPDTPGLENLMRNDLSGYPFNWERQPWQASVSLSLPILAGPQRRQRIAEARIADDDARLRVRTQELALRTDVATALINVRNYHETVQLQDKVVASATEELRLARERFRFGASSSLEVVDAQTNLAQAERDRIEAVYNFHKSLAALEALVGQPLR